MKRAVALAALALLLAGCGSHHTKPTPEPKLPRALAHAWSREADAVAAALAAGKPCLGQQRARRLLRDVVAAINARRVPQALLEQLTSRVNALPAQITCGPTEERAQPDAHRLAAWLVQHSR
ncbi:MAG TPA: hypothetical protein VF091_10035 [Gaiellaceae bacterium]